MNFSEERESGCQDDILLHEVDLKPEFFDGHPVLQVAVEAVGLFHQHGAAGLRLLQQRDHFAEAGAARRLRRLHVRELLEHIEAVGAGIPAEQFQLGRNRVAFLLLVLAGDARVNHGRMATAGGRSGVGLELCSFLHLTSYASVASFPPGFPCPTTS